MEIKINLESMFGSSKSEATQNDSRSQYSEQSQPSYVSSQGLRVNMWDEQPVRKEKAQVGKTNSVISVASEYQKVPGERLYYESRNNMHRRQEEIKLMQTEKELKEAREATFKPKINKNSQKIVNVKGKYVPPNKKGEAVPTHVRREKQQLIQCTFKPELTSKQIVSPNYYSQNRIEQLYNDHKMKEVRQKLKNQDFTQPNKTKKLSKQQFQSFLTRNNQFISKVQKKNEMILSTSNKFDLQTGHKMFSPKTNTFKSHLNYFTVNNKPERKQSNAQIVSRTQSAKTTSIFNKNYQTYVNENSSQNIKYQQNEPEQQRYDSYPNFHSIKQTTNGDENQQQVQNEQPIHETVQAFHLDEQQKAESHINQQLQKQKQSCSVKSKSSNFERSYSFQGAELESPVKHEQGIPESQQCETEASGCVHGGDI